jgi:hypothetical protein
VVISPDFAQRAVEAQNKINKACDEAGWLRSFTGAMWVFFFVRWIPLLGIVGWFGMAMTFFSAPVWLTYWWIRFGGIKTADIDFAAARRNWIISLFLWLLMLAVFFYLIVLPLALVAFRR